MTDKDQVEGRLKEGAGKVSGDEGLEGEGKVQGAWGDTKENVKEGAGDAVDKVRGDDD
jgi:uncharacterized protein YjbJ (UPF0337 family)